MQTTFLNGTSTNTSFKTRTLENLFRNLTPGIFIYRTIIRFHFQASIIECGIKVLMHEGERPIY